MKSFLLVFCLLFSGLYSGQKGSVYADIDQLLDSCYQRLSKVNLKKAEEFAQNAYNESKDTRYSKGISRALLYQSQIYFSQGKFKEALKCLIELENEAYFKKDIAIQADCARMKGRVYSSMELFDHGAKEFRKSLAYSLQIPEKSQRVKLTALGYESLIYFYTIRKKDDSVYYYLRKNMDFARKQDEAIIFNNLVNLNTAFGMYYSREKKNDSAAYYFKKSEEVATKHHFPYLSYNYRMWGMMELDRKNYGKAIQLLNKAVANIEESGIRSELPPLYTALSEAYKATGNLAKALEYKTKANDIEQGITTEKLRSSEYAVKQMVNDEVSDYKEKFGRFFMISFVSVLVIALALYFYFSKRNKKNKKILKEIEQESYQLKQKVNEGFEEMIQYAKDNDPKFRARFQELYPHFRGRILERNPDLKPSEMLLAAYTYLGFTTKDIAQYTYKAVKTIKNNKYNLRKRLDIPQQTDFMVWLRTYIDEEYTS